MAIYRTVSQTFWSDSKVDDDFTPEDKYGMLFFLTNPHSNLLGCYEIGMKQMANEMGYSKDTIEHLLKRMSEYHRVIEYDHETKELLVINWYKYNWTKSDKFLKALLSTLEKVKSQRFKKYLIEKIEEVYGTGTVSVLYGNNCSLFSVTDTVTDKEDRGVGEEETETTAQPEEDRTSVKQTKRSKRKTFVPPTVEEVRAYCQERNNHIDPEAFTDFYESKGWMIGKDKMKDWKAAVRTWEKREFGSGTKKDINTRVPEWYSNTKQKPVDKETLAKALEAQRKASGERGISECISQK